MSIQEYSQTILGNQCFQRIRTNSKNDSEDEGLRIHIERLSGLWCDAWMPRRITRIQLDQSALDILARDPQYQESINISQSDFLETYIDVAYNDAKEALCRLSGKNVGKNVIPTLREYGERSGMTAGEFSYYERALHSRGGSGKGSERRLTRDESIETLTSLSVFNLRYGNPSAARPLAPSKPSRTIPSQEVRRETIGGASSEQKNREAYVPQDDVSKDTRRNEPANPSISNLAEVIAASVSLPARSGNAGSERREVAITCLNCRRVQYCNVSRDRRYELRCCFCTTSLLLEVRNFSVLAVVFTPQKLSSLSSLWRFPSEGAACFICPWCATFLACTRESGYLKCLYCRSGIRLLWEGDLHARIMAVTRRYRRSMTVTIASICISPLVLTMVPQSPTIGIIEMILVFVLPGYILVKAGQGD